MYHDLSLIASVIYPRRRDDTTDLAIFTKEPLYVALGSSFAAGPSVGPKVQNTVGFQQGLHAYPFQLCDKLSLDRETQFINASSSGAMLHEIPTTQLKYLSHATKLVTLTAGGNDVHYTRDTILAYMFHLMQTAVIRYILLALVKIFSKERDFGKLRTSFDKVLSEIRQKSPNAVIVVVSYISVLPPDSALEPLSYEETQKLRKVADTLSEITSECAQANNAILVDMATLSGINHHAGSQEPWAIGFNSADGLIVHPNLAGHSAAANAIYKAIDGASVIN